MSVPRCCQREGVCSQIDKGSVHFFSCGKLRHGKFSKTGKKVGEGVGRGWRAKAFSHCQHGEQGDERRWGVILAVGKVPPSPAKPPLPQQLGFLQHQDTYSVKNQKEVVWFCQLLVLPVLGTILEHRGVVRKWLSWSPDVLKNCSSDSVLGAQSIQRLEN